MSFKLPPKVTSRKEKLGNHWVYIFRHEDLGNIGRLIIKPAPSGKSQIDAELIGDPSDPMFEQRAAIFKPLSLQLTNAMDQATSGGQPIQKSYSAPVHPPTRGKNIPYKLIPCQRCNKGIGLIILAPDAIELGQLEDYTRLMYPEMSKHDVPTWIVGGLVPSSGVDSRNEARCIVRKVYPQREDTFYASPEEFNEQTEGLLKKCCS